ncbi:hypothetical protein I3843_15G109900 [Carya illinoinensis]|nr:hypothetical protein I3843_15G109900 [Carya illinoinensis]KAG7944591.1 hypothetical protein I3843_15G109900 [Carya illinoinensis]KAG7944592.1 hypothetical protein I3843_15G109900 [Carya illinoinensis]
MAIVSQGHYHKVPSNGGHFSRPDTHPLKVLSKDGKFQRKRCALTWMTEVCRLPPNKLLDELALKWSSFRLALLLKTDELMISQVALVGH